MIRNCFLIYMGMVFGLSSSGFAMSRQDQRLIDLEREKERIENISYSLTKSLCVVPDTYLLSVKHNLNVEVQLDKIALRALKFSALTLNPAHMVQLAPSTEFFIKSPGYYAALNECYGNSITKKRLFTANIILADVSGHVAGLGVWVGAGLIGKAVLAGIAIRGGAVAAAATFAQRAGLAVAAGATTDQVLDLGKTIRQQHTVQSSQNVGTTILNSGVAADASALEAEKERLEEVRTELSSNHLTDQQRARKTAYAAALLSDIQSRD